MTGKDTRTINFGLMEPHEAIKQVDTYHKELHKKDFNLNVLNAKLPPKMT